MQSGSLAEIRLILIVLLCLLPRTETNAVARIQTQAQTEQPTQTDWRVLEMGKPLERELAGGQSHIYQLSLAAGQYLHIVTEQRGIDVVIAWFGPDGKKLIEVDSPNGTQGPETLTWITEAHGNYRLVIRSDNKEAKAGYYEVKHLELRAATEGDRTLIDALRLINESASLQGKGKFAEALVLTERALTLKERVLGPNHPDVAQLHNDIAGLYYYLGDYLKAEPRFQRALTIREQVLGPNHLDVAESLNDFAFLYSARGDYTKAEPLYQRALFIREQALGPNHPNVAISLNNLAIMYKDKGDYAKAESYYKRALAINEKTLDSNHPEIGTLLNNLASLYKDKGDYEQAELLSQRALAIWRKSLGDSHPNVGTLLNNIAVLNSEKGDYVKAELFYQQALAIREKELGPNHPDVANSLNNYAVLYVNKGDYANAVALHQRALAIRERTLGSTHPEVSRSLNELASLSQKLGDYVKAEQLYQRALAMREQSFGTTHPQVAKSLNDLATLYYDKEIYAKGEILCKRALAIREQSLGPNHPDVAESLNTLANLSRARGDYAKAEQFYRRALAIRENALGPNHPNVVLTLKFLAELYRAKGDVQQAIAVAARAAESSEINLNQTLVTGSERQKLSFLALREQETNLIVSLHTQAAPADPSALKLALTTLLRRKGRGLDAMSDALATLRRRASPQDQPLFEQLVSTRSQLAALTLRGPGRTPTDQFRTQLQQLADEADKLEANLSSRSAKFRAQAQPLTISAIQAALPTNAALVEFATYHSHDTKAQKNGLLHYVAYTLTAQGEPRWVELGEAAPIERAITAWRQALRNRHRMDVQRLARAVDAKVMQPVRALLGDGKHLLLSPDGMLNLIPFAALVDEQGRYLVSRYECSYLTSGRDLLRLQVPRESKRDALIVANPAFGERANPAALASRQVTLPSPGAASGPPQFDFSQAYFDPLPGTAGEAQTIQRLLPQATVLTQEQATKAALQQINAPRLLHIATHGFFLRDAKTVVANSRRIRLPGESLETDQPSVPMIDPLVRSGLALAGANLHKGGIDNGILTAKEAAGLNLWGTKLVVLSACDTGVGEVKNGEGVYGLRRAFVLAGAETQVMSLWPVSDQGTRELMIDYYKGLQRGEGRSAALHKVQLRMLKNPARRHPYYWASFIPSGEWANLDGQR